MVTARKIRCVVVLAESETVGMHSSSQPRFRPSDLLPWADPHIRSLVEQLQREVREEEAERRANSRQEFGGPMSAASPLAGPRL